MREPTEYDDLEWANTQIERTIANEKDWHYYYVDIQDRADRRHQVKARSLEDQIRSLKEQVHQQSDLIARMESKKKGGFW